MGLEVRDSGGKGFGAIYFWATTAKNIWPIMEDDGLHANCCAQWHDTWTTCSFNINRHPRFPTSAPNWTIATWQSCNLFTLCSELGFDRILLGLEVSLQLSTSVSSANLVVLPLVGSFCGLFFGCVCVSSNKVVSR